MDRRAWRGEVSYEGRVVSSTKDCCAFLALAPAEHGDVRDLATYGIGRHTAGHHSSVDLPPFAAVRALRVVGHPARPVECTEMVGYADCERSGPGSSDGHSAIGDGRLQTKDRLQAGRPRAKVARGTAVVGAPCAHTAMDKCLRLQLSREEKEVCGVSRTNIGSKALLPRDASGRPPVSLARGAPEHELEQRADKDGYGGRVDRKSSADGKEVEDAAERVGAQPQHPSHADRIKLRQHLAAERRQLTPAANLVLPERGCC